MSRLARFVCAAVAPAVFAAAPAHAAGELGLSWDGLVWHHTLSGDLFGAGPPARWVPGDRDTRIFHVRNQTGDPGRLHVEYGLGTDEGLFGPQDLRVSARLGAGPWIALRDGGGWLTLHHGGLTGGDRATVEVRAVFDPASSNLSQGRFAPLLFRVTLTGEAGEPAPGTGTAPATGDSGPGGPLPVTGSPLIRWLAGLAALLTGGGLALIVHTRRKETAR